MRPRHSDSKQKMGAHGIPRNAIPLRMDYLAWRMGDVGWATCLAGTRDSLTSIYRLWKRSWGAFWKIGAAETRMTHRWRHRVLSIFTCTPITVFSTALATSRNW